MKNKELIKELVIKYSSDMDKNVLSKGQLQEITGNGKEGLLKEFLYLMKKSDVSLNYDELIKDLKQRPTLIFEIEKPTEEMIQAVLNSGKTLADFVNHSDEKFVRRVLVKDPYVFRHIEKPSKDLVYDYLLKIKSHDDYNWLVLRMLETIYK